MAPLHRHGAEPPGQGPKLAQKRGAPKLSGAGAGASRGGVLRTSGGAALSAARISAIDTVASATLSVATAGAGFFEITAAARRFLDDVAARDGVLFVFLRHTSASLAIQENADADVQVDLRAALDRLAPVDGGWAHQAEGPDDMPAHVKAMLTGVSLHVPVCAGVPTLGTWQGIYLVEHRARPHRREVVLQFIGAKSARG